MPGLFSRLKGKDAKSKKKNAGPDLADSTPSKPQWDDAWTRKTVEPEEIHELVRCCTEELKARGLDLPFLLLPFRPTSDPSAVRTFIRHFFDQNHPPRGEALLQEIRIAEPMVLSGVVKWCWSRMQGGVVGWDAYELFKVGEYDSNMARDSFKTFIPISVENGARQRIIFDFFDLLAAVAAHGKTNGFGGRKLSRMAAWWAFEQKDTGNGFEGGYNSWLSAADATSHLFFAYLRSLAPETNLTGISMLPRSLQKLVQETEYPPMKPDLLMSRTNKVVMIVETVSPTPFSLLRRANHFQYRDSDRALQEFSEYEDPVQALSEECKRVLKAVSAANQSQVSSAKHSTSLREASWSRFEDIGFSSALEEDEDEDDSALTRKHKQRTDGLRTSPSSGNVFDRPTTPSWADFLSSGFVDDSQSRPNLLLPPDKVLPPLDTQSRQRSSQSHRPRLESDQDLDPGELASITFLDLDDAFWWVWMSSLAPEETPDRKAAFGRCAVVETKITSGRWLVMEEMVAGAAPEPQEGAYIAEKKGLFSWTRRGKSLGRRKSTGKQALDHGDKGGNTFGSSKTNIGPDTHARIQAKAAQLRAASDQEKQEALNAQRRGRDADSADKTKSVMSLQPTIVGEASSAMKWVKKYDKASIKDAYMANSYAGRGTDLSLVPTEDTNGHYESNGAAQGSAKAPEPPMKEAAPAPEPQPAAPAPALASVPASPVPQRKPVGSSVPVNPVSAATEPSQPVVPEPHEQPALVQDLPEQPESAPVPEPEAQPPPPPKDNPVEELPAPEPAVVVTESGKKKPNKGFRKLFSRKNRGSKLPDNAAADVNEMLRKDAQTPTQPTTIQENEPASVAEPTLEMPMSDEAQRPHDGDELSRVNTKDAAEAQAEFSRFDQGPLQDQPAFVPDDDAASDATPRSITRRAPNRNGTSIKSSHEIMSEEKLAQSTSPGIQDRWAQIRKNAAERAAQYQRPEDELSSRGPERKHSGHDEDDDTSAEETIESRVARIKARVAEITGTMEGVQGPTGPGDRTPQPSRSPQATSPAAE
ncbi:Morphogenesis-related protein-like protein [Emericellopsis cladophorae]|uniref:Morphogenesis-related protein-like protein n=1 Tax=Emericellopsis cladophorae TaxID=2686198 RepID=A0A9Q0BEM5_9HYPO|nr:Morphogenesis-related protein-like protein [Emericellopsis cladophorae]KAI6783077.1 Morphogenesis-related protein-like protein [Emericellopsis cladophorae]